jgi:heat shock protein HslJ
MRRTLVVLPLLVLLAVAAACGSGGDRAGTPTSGPGTTAPVTSDPSTTAPTGDRPLVGTTWVLETMIDERGSAPVPAGASVTLVMPSPTEITWQACNRYAGSMTTTERTITLGDVQSTLMACTGPLEQVEPAMGMVLSGTVTYEIQGDVLRLRNGDRGLDLRAA